MAQQEDSKLEARLEEMRRVSPVWQRVRELQEQKERQQAQAAEQQVYEELPVEAREAKQASAIQAPPRMIQAYLDGKANNVNNPERMTREQMMEFERYVARGSITVPSGVITFPTEEAGIIGGIREAITGAERATPTTEALRDWSYLPEFEDMGVATKFAIMTAGIEEAAKIIKANFPDIGVRRDERGNFIFRSAKSGEEFAVKPGFQPSDIARLGARAAVALPVAAAGAALAPAGALGAIGAGALTGAAEEAIVETAQAAQPGGTFDAEEIALGALTGGALPAVGAAARPALRRAAPLVEAGRAAVAQAAEPMVAAGRGAVARVAEPIAEAARGAAARLPGGPEAALARQLSLATPEVRPAGAVPGIARPAVEAVPEATAMARRAADEEMAMALAAGEMAPTAARAPGALAGAAEEGRRFVPRGAPTPAAAPVVRETVEEILPIRNAVAEALPDVPVSAVNDVARLTRNVPISDADLGALLIRSQKSGRAGEVARMQLAEMLELNVDDAALAKFHGFDVPEEYFIDNRRLRALAGMEASQVGSQAKTILDQSVLRAADRTKEILKKFDARYSDEGDPLVGRVSDEIRGSVVRQQAEMKELSSELYGKVDRAMNGKFVPVSNTRAYFDNELKKVSLDSMSPAEQRLYADVQSAIYQKYGDLQRWKTDITRALANQKSPYADVDYRILTRLNKALTEDMMAGVEAVSPELRQTLRKANLLTAGKKALEKRIVTLFGKDFVDNIPTGDIAQQLVSAVKEPIGAGGVGRLRKLIKMLPEESRREALSTGFARAVTDDRGNISPALFIKTFRAIDTSEFAPQFYAILGPGSKEALGAAGAVMQRMALATGGETIRTGASLQKVLEEAVSTRALNRLLASNVSRSVLGTISGGIAGGAGALVGGVIGKPGFGAAVGASGGSALATNIIENIVGAKGITKDFVKLLRDKNFQKMMIESAKGNSVPSQGIIETVAKSEAFSKYGDELGLDKSPEVRVRFIKALFSAPVAGRAAAQETRRQVTAERQPVMQR